MFYLYIHYINKKTSRFSDSLLKHNTQKIEINVSIYAVLKYTPQD